MIEFLTSVIEVLKLGTVILLQLLFICGLVGLVYCICTGNANNKNDIDEDLARKLRTLKKEYPDKTVKSITIRKNND